MHFLSLDKVLSPSRFNASNLCSRLESASFFVVYRDLCVPSCPLLLIDELSSYFHFSPYTQTRMPLYLLSVNHDMRSELIAFLLHFVRLCSDGIKPRKRL